MIFENGGIMEGKKFCRFGKDCRIAYEKCDPSNCIHVSLNNFPGTCSHCKRKRGVKPTNDVEKPFICISCLKTTNEVSFPEFEKQELPLPA
ncbi:MAG: hypothetical protein ABH830_01800 [Patescibacteria group bacterium]